MDFKFSSIGYIKTDYKSEDNMPIQGKDANGTGIVVVDDNYLAGLDGLEMFKYVILIYVFHKSKAVRLKVVPFLDSVERGVFATRAPVRPNHLGFSVVRLLRRDGNKLYVSNIDVLDGTPLLDIKPYIAKFDIYEDANNGWLSDDLNISKIKSDGRFK